ncbi:hypothetical protein E2C01_048457 [Portunus trituberculatus]|uniref:Uncharacterized protein n=1 Tax=Portunus trituberculatus TaxID=210409 RepID=A0A5B7GAL4_PORTR|nr:hypothetical protein [Portunus trituberculatus]
MKCLFVFSDISITKCGVVGIKVSQEVDWNVLSKEFTEVRDGYVRSCWWLIECSYDKFSCWRVYFDCKEIRDVLPLLRM